MAKGTKKEEAKQDAQSLLARLRPRRRSIFFLIFVVFCSWILLFYDGCQIPDGKKRDCGYSGISPSYCITGSCFTSRGGKQEKKVIKLNQASDETLGVTVIADEGKGSSDWVLIQSIGEGAVKRYNEQQVNDTDKILPGDCIAKVGGISSKKKIIEAIKKSEKKTVELEIRATKLPSYLRWIKRSVKPNLLETVLTAPGFFRWSRLTSQIGAVGFTCWLFSGYPVASLPLYYFSLSAAVGLKLTRCCHDEKVGGGVAHCYQQVKAEPLEVLQKAWTATTELATHLTKKWRKIVKELGGSLKNFPLMAKS